MKQAIQKGFILDVLSSRVGRVQPAALAAMFSAQAPTDIPVPVQYPMQDEMRRLITSGGPE